MTAIRALTWAWDELKQEYKDKTNWGDFQKAIKNYIDPQKIGYSVWYGVTMDKVWEAVEAYFDGMEK